MSRKPPSRNVRIKRAYEPAAPEDGARVLIDRLWPRGIKKDALALTHWERELAPSTELRKWFGHEPAKFDAFRTRYIVELRAQAETLQKLQELACKGALTIVYGAHDEQHNNAVVVRELLLDLDKLGA